MRLPTGLYVSKRLARDARWKIATIETLRGLPLLTYTSSYQMLQEAKWFQPILASAAIALETNSTHALAAAAIGRAGVAVLPRFVARAHSELTDVSDDVATHDVWLITHPEFRRDPKVSVTAGFLKHIAASL